MRFYARAVVPVFCALVLTALLSTVSFADASHDRTQFGHDITVNAGEETSEVTCFGCSVRIRGKVSGDVTTFGGAVVVEQGGEISGDLTSFGGDVRLDSGAEVKSGVTLFGGRLRRDAEASIGGDVTTFSGGFWLLLIFGLPLMMLAGFVLLVVWIVRRLTRPSMPVPARV